MTYSLLTHRHLRKGFLVRRNEVPDMKYIIATNNPKKLLELERILNPLGIQAVTAKSMGIELEDVEETGTTFAENAQLKARAACKRSGMPAIADDSGLMVDALNGEPGVYSARYAGENATDEQRNTKLLYNLRDVPECNRSARFASAICCTYPDGREINVYGECEGRIAFEPRGKGGFGYDPVFLVEGDKSYAELSKEEKDKISHRGNALRLLAQKLEELGETKTTEDGE